MTDRRDERPLRRRDQALVVQLADGAPTGAAYGRAKARLRSIPYGERLIERQRRVARAVGAGAALPPLDPAGSPAPRQPARRLVTAGAFAAVLAVLLVLAAQGGDPTPERAADIAQLPATDRAPEASGTLLHAEVDGVVFPDWEPEFGWRATGMRRDEVRAVPQPRSSTSTRATASRTRSSPGPRSRGPPARESSSATASRCPCTATRAVAVTTSPCSSATDAGAWSRGTS